MADEERPLMRLSDLVGLPSRKDRMREQMRILEALMAQAVKEKDWKGALAAFKEAHTILNK